MEASRYADLFLAESREHVSRMNRVLLVLEGDAGDAGAVEELFRSVHTVKGMSAAMGYERSAEVAHALEQLLEPVRGGALSLDRESVEALFQGVDALERTLEAETAEGAKPPTLEPAKRGAAVEGGAARELRATVMIAPTASLPAVRAVLVLRKARELGEVDEVQPPEERLTAGEFPGSLKFRLRTDREPEEIRAALLGAGEVAHLALEAAEGEEGTAGEAAAGPGAGRGALVRIEQGRLDLLLDGIGEMVIARDRLERLARARRDPELDELSDHLSRLVGTLRDEVMEIRMAPVGEVFERFPRLVRDAARTLDRRVRLTITGSGVQLDRALLNELGDLLVHLLRNAVDHGIEPPEERVAAGKAEEGEVGIAAVRRGSQVVVEVRDDGRGISRTGVAARAAERGWIAPDREEPLSDSELRDLITRPGFSTADRVTELSGRGVGLDVVGTRIRSLGGTLRVETDAGRGSAFTLALPMTLSIVRSLLVEVGGASFAVPIRSVAEVAETTTETLEEDGARWLRLREERIRLHPLHPLAGAEPPAAIASWLPVVVVEGPAGGIGLLVDRLVGQVEAVVKPFDAPRGVYPVFSGSTLLPDGRITLILDGPRLAAWLATRAERTTPDHVC